MKHSKEIKGSKPLSGKDNERINNVLGDRSEATAAWADIDHLEGPGNIPVPSTNAVEEAKEWVDNGSQL